MRAVCLLAAALMCGAPFPVMAADAAADMMRGREARARNDFPAAEAAFLEATRQNPTDAEAWHMLGLMRGFQGKYETALEALSRAQQLAPADLDISLSVARINSFAGGYAEADRQVDALLARQPALAEAWVLKGRIASYQNRPRAARTAYDKAASLGALDVDLLLAYGDLSRAEGKEAEARSYYARAAALDPASADVQSRLAEKNQAIATPWTMSISGGKSWLSRTPAPDWQAAEALLDRDLGGGVHVFGGAAYAKRFSLKDVMLRAGANVRSGRLAASLDLGVTPGDDVLPEFQAMSSLSVRLNDGGANFGPTVAVLDGQVRRYANGTVKSLSPGFDQYLADGRLTLSLRMANSWDTTDRHLVGWSGGVLWQLTEKWRLRLGYGNAPEAERGAVADTKTLSGSLIVDLSDTLTWRFDLARESRQGGYRRIEATSGFAVKF
jgi:YaiO family outer membrane protein